MGGEKQDDKDTAKEEKEAATEKTEEESLEEEIKKAEAAVELTEQEKAICFSKADVEDLAQKDLSKFFGSFTLPDKAEGFDEVRFVWQKGPACEEYLKAWIKERKLTQRVEDLVPGDWFKEQVDLWTGVLQEWRNLHNDWNDPAKRSRLLKTKREKDDNKENKTDGKKGDDESKDNKQEEKVEGEDNGDTKMKVDDEGK